MTKRDNVLEKFANLNRQPPSAKNRSSIRWFRTQVKNNSVSPRRVLRDPEISRNLKRAPEHIKLGELLLFRYDPKHKEKLPFYDVYPLSIIMSTGVSKAGEKYVISLNLHYLTQMERERLLTAIYKSNTKGGAQEVLALVQRLSYYPGFRHAIKMHLLNHMVGNVLSIPFDEWALAVNIPSGFISKNKQKKTQNAILRQARTRRRK